jgi:hypothetical protein
MGFFVYTPKLKKRSHTMADDKEKSLKGGIRVDDAIRLKHEINKSITYQGFNAKEVEELANMTSEDYRKIRLKYAGQLKEWTIIPDFVWYALSIVGILLIFWNAVWYLKLVGLVCVGYSALQIGSRVGNPAGFIIGYEWGLSDGVYKALGIDDKEAADIHDRSIEMEMDEKLIKRMDEGTSERGKG